MEKAASGEVPARCTQPMDFQYYFTSCHIKGIFFSPNGPQISDHKISKTKGSQYTGPQASQSLAENTLWDNFSFYSVWLAFTASTWNEGNYLIRPFVEELADSPACWTKAKLCSISLVTTANKYAQKGGDNLLTQNQVQFISTLSTYFNANQVTAGQQQL